MEASGHACLQSPSFPGEGRHLFKQSSRHHVLVGCVLMEAPFPGCSPILAGGRGARKQCRLCLPSCRSHLPLCCTILSTTQFLYPRGPQLGAGFLSESTDSLWKLQFEYNSVWWLKLKNRKGDILNLQDYFHHCVCLFGEGESLGKMSIHLIRSQPCLSQWCLKGSL